MNTSRSVIFRRFTRTFYLLGIVFLMAGMFLSIAAPAQAGSAPSNQAQATRLPPGSVVQPPAVQPPSSKPPVVAPVAPPSSAPGNQPSGPGAQNLNRAPAMQATPVLRSGPSIQAVIPGASIRFTRSDYCYDGPAGDVSATVVITLPEGVGAYVQTDWYVVNPRSGDIVHHYFTPERIFYNGESYTFTGQWPGRDAWPTANGNPVEIHFGVNLRSAEDGSLIIEQGVGLDLFYSGTCGARIPLTLSSECQEDGSVLWTLTNPNDVTSPLPFTYTVTDGTSGSGTLTSKGTATFTTNPGVTVTVSYDDGIGGTATVSQAGQETCGETVLLPLSLAYRCVIGQNTLQWTVTNDNATAVSFTWQLDGGAISAPVSVPANEPLDFTTSSSTVAHVMTLRWQTPAGVPDSVQISSPADACGAVTPPPPPTLILEFACVDADNIQWTAVNPGTTPVTFDWDRDSGLEIGQDEAPANTPPSNGRVNFVVTNDTTAHTVSITWSTETGTLTVSRSSAADVCGEIVTITPTVITPTNTPVTPTVTVITPTNTPVTPTITSTPITVTGTPVTPTSTTVVTNPTRTPTTVVNNPTRTPTQVVVITGTQVPVTGGTPVVSVFQATNTAGPTSTPIATVGIPETGASASQNVSPQTGADMSQTTPFGLWQKLLFNGGLLFFGLALIFEGLGRKFR